MHEKPENGVSGEPYKLLGAGMMTFFAPEIFHTFPDSSDTLKRWEKTTKTVLYDGNAIVRFVQVLKQKFFEALHILRMNPGAVEPNQAISRSARTVPPN